MHVKFVLTLLELVVYCPGMILLNCYHLMRKLRCLIPDSLGYLNNVVSESYSVMCSWIRKPCFYFIYKTVSLRDNLKVFLMKL